MKRAVSVSLGSPTRDKKVEVHLNNQLICVERLGTGGDEKKARHLFARLDGRVDALSVGGIDLYVHLDGRDYPVHAALKMVQDVQKTPLVDGRMLKYALEGRVFELAAPALGGLPRETPPGSPTLPAERLSSALPSGIVKVSLASAANCFVP